MDKNRQINHGGVSVTPRSTGTKRSWEAIKPEPPKPPVAIKREYPKADLQRSSVQNHQFWQGGEGGTPGGRKPSGGGDLGNYGFPLPRYSAPQQAVNTYTSGDKFDPKQTLFRYDPQTLNVLAEATFRRDPANAGKSFLKPYDEKNPVYEGFPDRHGATGFGRAWDHNRSNESRPYLFDLRDYNQQFKKQVEEKLSRGEAVALREYFALPSEPTRISKASVDPWSGSPDPSRKVTASRTIGGGEQIIGDPKYFKFEKP